MDWLFIAIGNPLRRDDGVAARVLTLLAPCPGIERKTVHQLTPECALEMARLQGVLFIDADAQPGAVRLEPVEPAPVPVRLGHSFTPGQLVGMAAELYGYRGQAWLCRIPVSDFGLGEGLSEAAEAGARAAADLIGRLCASLRG